MPPRCRAPGVALILLLLGGVGALAAGAPPAPAPPFTPVATGPRAQVQPAACRLASGSTVLAFEWLAGAHQRYVYVKRRRPGSGWSDAAPLPAPVTDGRHRHPTLVALAGDAVWLYVQSGDRRRGSGIRALSTRGDGLAFRDHGLLALGGAAGTSLALPHATRTPTGDVLLAVTRTPPHGPARCTLHRGPGGVAFRAVAELPGPAETCRAVAPAGQQLVVTYQVKDSRRSPWVGEVRRSLDGGRTFGTAWRITAATDVTDLHPVALADGRVWIVFATGAGRLRAVTLGADGAQGADTAVGPAEPRRHLHPFGLLAGAGLQLFLAREAHPLDFDVVEAPVAVPAP
jgi:hypothetical protein